jgi:hypothetical protein
VQNWSGGCGYIVFSYNGWRQEDVKFVSSWLARYWRVTSVPCRLPRHRLDILLTWNFIYSLLMFSNQDILKTCQNYDKLCVKNIILTLGHLLVLLREFLLILFTHAVICCPIQLIHDFGCWIMEFVFSCHVCTLICVRSSMSPVKWGSMLKYPGTVNIYMYIGDVLHCWLYCMVSVGVYQCKLLVFITNFMMPVALFPAQC